MNLMNKVERKFYYMNFEKTKGIGMVVLAILIIVFGGFLLCRQLF